MERRPSPCRRARVADARTIRPRDAHAPSMLQRAARAQTGSGAPAPCHVPSCHPRTTRHPSLPDPSSLPLTSGPRSAGATAPTECDVRLPSLARVAARATTRAARSRRAYRVASPHLIAQPVKGASQAATAGDSGTYRLCTPRRSAVHSAHSFLRFLMPSLRCAAASRPEPLAALGSALWAHPDDFPASPQAACVALSAATSHSEEER